MGIRNGPFLTATQPAEFSIPLRVTRFWHESQSSVQSLSATVSVAIGASSMDWIESWAGHQCWKPYTFSDTPPRYDVPTNVEVSEKMENSTLAWVECR